MIRALNELNTIGNRVSEVKRIQMEKQAMSNYFYIQSEPGLWTVGTGDPKTSSQWFPESDHESPEKAAKRVAFLNDGVEMKDYEALAKYSAKRIGELESTLREVITNVEFDELGLQTLNDKIRKLLSKAQS